MLTKSVPNACLAAVAALVLTVPPAVGQGIPLTPEHLLAACDSMDLEEYCSGNEVDSNDPNGVVVATYTDPTTKNTASLIARNDGLYCHWEAGNNPYLTSNSFMPAAYFGHCYVNNPNSPNTKFGKPLNDALPPMEPAGELKLLSFIPKADLQWTFVIKAAEISSYNTTTKQTDVGYVEKSSSGGGFGLSLGGFVTFVGKLFTGKVDFGLDLGYSSNSDVTSWNIAKTFSDVRISERHASMLGLQNWYVSLVPKITYLGWTAGKTWGCDSLDVVESILGEREISKYSVRLASVGAPNGKLTVDMKPSELHSVVSRGSFTSLITADHGFEATYSGRMPFDSTVTYEADYEFPEDPFSLVGGGLTVQDQGGNSFFLEYGLLVLDETLVVGLKGWNGPAEWIQQAAATITRADLVATGGSLPRVIVSKLLTQGDPVQPLDSPCILDTQLMQDMQPWRADATISGFSTGVASSKQLPVLVYLDLFPQGCFLGCPDA